MEVNVACSHLSQLSFAKTRFLPLCMVGQHVQTLRNVLHWTAKRAVLGQAINSQQAGANKQLATSEKREATDKRQLAKCCNNLLI